MMQIYARLDPTGTYPHELRGFIDKTIENPPGMVAMPQGKSIDECGLLMLIEGAWTIRPAIEKPAIRRTDTGFAVRFENAPIGATCTIFDLDYSVMLGEVAADALTIEFEIAQAGRYQLDVVAPLPWLGLTINVVLT